jgi:putative oxidoreductase
MSVRTGTLEAPRDGALWVVQGLGATLFLISGLAKLSGDHHMIQSLAAIGIHQGFRYVGALIEFVSAILLLVPAISGVGALLLVPIMIGAILAHLLVVGGSLTLPTGLLIIACVVAWGRKETSLRLIWRSKS